MESSLTKITNNSNQGKPLLYILTLSAGNKPQLKQSAVTSIIRVIERKQISTPRRPTRDCEPEESVGSV